MDKKSYALVAAVALAIILALIALVCCFRQSMGGDCCVVADWVWVLVQFGVSGAFGGFLTYIANTYFDSNGSDEGTPQGRRKRTFASRIKPDAWMIFVHCMGGVGGAYAVLFFLAQSEKMNDIQMDSPFILKNVGWGFIAGFIGFPLLIRVAKSAEGLLGEMNKLKQQQRADEEESRARDELNAALQVASDEYMNWRVWKSQRQPGAAPAPVFEPGPGYAVALNRLEDAWKKFPHDRNAAMKLSNLHYVLAAWAAGPKIEEHRKAVEILTTTINAIDARFTPENADESNRNLSDLLFNRACNNARLHEAVPAAEKPDLKRQVIADLRRSLELNPLNRPSAQRERDGDFDGLANDPEFRAVVGL